MYTLHSWNANKIKLVDGIRSLSLTLNNRQISLKRVRASVYFACKSKSISMGVRSLSSGCLYKRGEKKGKKFKQKFTTLSKRFDSHQLNLNIECGLFTLSNSNNKNHNNDDEKKKYFISILEANFEEKQI